MIIIIGRGHAGTRSIAQTLFASNVYMGNLLNNSADLVPPDKLYEACKIFGKKVKYIGDYKWDFKNTYEDDIPEKFIELIKEYLDPVIKSKNPNKGWKIPETTLIYPWIYQMFPNAKYIFWVRHPFDAILGEHLTDGLGWFEVSTPTAGNIFQKRAISWLYHFRIQQQLPKPEHSIEIRFEDFITNQGLILEKLEKFLGIKLAQIPMRAESISKWKGKINVNEFKYLFDAMDYYHYEYQ